MKKLLSSIIALLIIFQFTVALAQVDLTSATEQFIETNMKNSNGTLASYLLTGQSSSSEIVTGQGALSESMGLMLKYLLQKQDRKSFEVYYQAIKAHFISPASGIVYWKIDEHGLRDVNTNALLDDWRIANALFAAGEQWKEPEYIQAASNICQALYTKNSRDGYLVDFYDEYYDVNNQTISLFFIDPEALSYMLKYKLIDQKTYNKMNSLLRKAPNDGVFFAKNYDVVSQAYTYDTQIHMVEQLYTAYFRKLAGVDSKSFYQFVKDEFTTHQVLYGQYHRATRLPAVQYESNAVYGLLILYALEMDDVAFAKRVYERMKEYEISDIAANPYYGGYVVLTPSGYDTHIFDNLLPLLAKQRLESLPD